MLPRVPFRCFCPLFDMLCRVCWFRLGFGSPCCCGGRRRCLLDVVERGGVQAQPTPSTKQRAPVLLLTNSIYLCPQPRNTTCGRGAFGQLCARVRVTGSRKERATSRAVCSGLDSCRLGTCKAARLQSIPLVTTHNHCQRIVLKVSPLCVGCTITCVLKCQCRRLRLGA